MVHLRNRHGVRCLCAAMILTVLLTVLPVSALAGSKPVLYNGKVTTIRYPNSKTVIYSEMTKDLTYFLAEVSPGYKVRITAVYPNWLEIEYKNGYAYVLRNRIDVYDPIDRVNTPYCGTEKYEYYSDITRDVPVLADKDDNSTVLASLTAGSRIAILGFEDGYAKLVFKRQYCYVNSNLLEHVMPVARTVDQGTDTIPIAAFTSFATDDENRNINLTRCGERLDRVYMPKQKLDFNAEVGPFTKANGYVEAGILADGDATTGTGGGSCQVSSTLFNTVLQLPGIAILQRQAHGNNGAKYLPYGMDAASAGPNFRMRNDYPFPIRIETVMHDTCLTMLVYRVSE